MIQGRALYRLPATQAAVPRQRRLAQAIALAFSAGALAGLPLAASAAGKPCPGNITGNVHISNLQLNTGTCQVMATATLTVDTAGTLLNSGTFTNNANGTLLNSGSLTNSATGLLNNVGSLNNSSGGTLSNGGELGNSGLLINGAQLTNSGVLNNSASGEITNTGTLTNKSGATLRNSGQLTSSGQLVNNYLIYNLGSLSNSGTLNDNYALYNYSKLNNAGTLTVGSIGFLYNAKGAQFINTNTLSNGGYVWSDGSISNSGTINNNAQMYIVDNGVLSNTGALNNSSQLGNYGSLTNSGTLTNNSGARLTNYLYASVSNSGVLNNRSGGLLSNSGTFSNLAGATLGNAGSVTNDSYGKLHNQGTLINSAGATVTNRGLLSNDSGGVFNNAGSLTNSAGATLSNAGSLVNSGSISNSGRFQVSNGGNVSGNGSFQQAAGITQIDGQMSQGLIDIAGGLLKGSGTISSANTIKIGSAATVAPGDSPGTLTLAGNVDFAGTLSIEVASATSFSVLVVQGALSFLPGAHVSLVFDFAPNAPLYTLNFLSAGSISGWNGLTYDDGGLKGYNGNLSCSANGCSFTLTQAVPEPETWAMWLAGIGALGGTTLLRRRRTRADG